MVAPDFQIRGIDKALAQKTVTDLTNDGVRCIQVAYTPELEDFYKNCSFHIFKYGIIDMPNVAIDRTIHDQIPPHQRP